MSSFYRCSNGHHLTYNKRFCEGCKTAQPRERGQASKKWRCAECRKRAAEDKAEK